MIKRQRMWPVVAAVAALLPLAGCARDAAAPTYAQRYGTELEQERAEFIIEQRGKLQRIDQRIAMLENQLDQVPRGEMPREYGRIRQRLFELKNERREVETKLQRARNASPEEWEEMRGALGRTIDSLEAGVATLWERTTGAIAGAGRAAGDVVRPQPDFPERDIDRD